MCWCYEIRGSENRLVELRCGFATENEARGAGTRAKDMIDCIGYPNLETLTLTVLAKEEASALDHLTQMLRSSEAWRDPRRAAKGAADLKFPWQQAILDALLEPHPRNVALKISVAERAISKRLLDSAPMELDERMALGEALLGLRRLLRQIAAEQESGREDSREKEGVA